MKINFLLLFVVLFFSGSTSLDAQTITYQVDGESLYLSENGDCVSGPDPRWQIRAKTQHTGIWSNWNTYVDDISGAGWHNYTNYSWINNTSVPNNAILTVQLNAWEEDPAACDNPCVFCSNGGPDDGSCGGYSNVSIRTITDQAPCTWNYHNGAERSCTDDGVTIRWNVRYSYYYTYDDLFPGSIGGGGSYYSCSDPPAFTSTGSATKWATYQWEQSTNGGTTWTAIGGATAATYNPGPLTVTTQFRRRANDCSGRVRYSNVRTITILNNGNPGTFGNNVWNVYAYNGRSLNFGGTSYRGYYVDNNLNINTQNYWTSGGTPSSASSYVGCTVGIDNHTTVHKRQGFPCGEYRLDIVGHDDEIRVYVNGAQVYEHMGCCDAHTGAWAGYLNGTSTIEVRTAEGGGGSNTAVNLVNTTVNVGGSVSNSQTVCSGVVPNALTSSASATGAGSINYQWQLSFNNSTWTNIGGATGLTYTPPIAPTQTTYYRRRAIDQCATVLYSNTITINIYAALNAGSVSNNQTICAGITPATLISTANATGGNGSIYQWQLSVNNSSWTNIGGATGATYSPSSLTQRMYYRRRSISNCGDIAYSNTITIDVNTLSTAPIPTPLTGKLCPNTDLALTAAGGIAGTGSSIEWYSNAAGTISVGSGSPTVSPSQTTTYYVRREGACNTTNLEPLVVNVKDYIYTPIGTSVSSNFCDDNLGWRHFYDLNDDIIFSVQGDFSGVITMDATIENNGTYHQETEGPTYFPADCANGWSPGEERFELPRSWNVNYTGTLTGAYNIRYYFPATEKTNIEIAAANHIAAWPACVYTYKYNPGNNGFFWFKNNGTVYTAPQFETPLQLTGALGTVNALNYSQITGVTSFSGGSGGIILEPLSSLPIELLSFKGENQGLKNYITWVTETELNNDYFELEHSTNLAEGFQPITKIKGAGTTNDRMEYSFMDLSPTVGINYYRLKQVDFDGQSALSNVIALEVKGDLLDYAFFPNPTKGEVTYQFNSRIENTITIKVINALGQTIENLQYNSKLGVNSVKIDLSEYPSGNYLIQVSDDQMSRIVTERITKVN